MMKILTLLILFTLSHALIAEEIGSVSTTWRALSPNDKIIIEAFDDPKIQGVTCHLSRAKKGGISGAMGLATDTSDASIACRQIGPISITGQLKDGEEVFKKSTSIIFKSLQVVRFFDKKRNTLIYLVYSDRLINGSPKNSISTIPITTWR